MSQSLDSTSFTVNVLTDFLLTDCSTVKRIYWRLITSGYDHSGEKSVMEARRVEEAGSG